jgi:upstream activation factor subunit UAF30
MVRTTKNAQTKTAPAATTPVESTKTASTKTASKKTTASKKVVEVKPEVVEVKQEIVAEPVSNEMIEESTVSKKINEFGAKLQQIGTIFTTMKGDFKSLEKIINRELKAAAKISAKKAKRAGNRQPSGFVKPTLISDELAKFLGKSIGTEMARTEVSKEINEYIRANKLQNKKNGRIIEADAKLSTLLKLTKEDELSYFNLQRYMKNHFIKIDSTTASASV